MIDLLENWPTIAERIKSSGRVLLMLDVDGTLAPIVPQPEDARIPDRTQRVLNQLAQASSVTLAFVSGRSVSDVRRMVGISNAHYFGAHGRQRMRPLSTRIEVDESFAEAIGKVRTQLETALADTPEFWVENKQVSAAAHFRNVPSARHDFVAKTVDDVLERFPMLHVSAGKMVFDITPLDGIDKGVATAVLLNEVGSQAFYFGDDTTDETAFKALPAEVVTVYVGPPESQSAARYRVTDPDQVAEALERISVAVPEPGPGGAE